jgi:hypothetical protein
LPDRSPKVQLIDAPRKTGPQLVPPHSPRRSGLALWHLLSLDAPTVAALWTWFIAHCAHVTLPWTAPIAMFVAVWMIYAADRLLDARVLDTAQHPAILIDLEERHRFHYLHRKRFLIGMACGALTLGLLLPHIYPRALVLYTLLASMLGVWMLLIHALPQSGNGARRLPKEFAVGIFFPAACFIPTVAHAPWLQLQLLPAAALFAAVCSLNCLYLYAWEHPSSPHPPRNAHWTTLWSIRHLVHLSLLILMLGVVLALSFHAIAALTLACTLSVVCLLTLHMNRRRIRAVHLRAAADLVLLTPVLFLLHP